MKKEAKPIFDVKTDFVQSLDQFCVAALGLEAAARAALDVVTNQAVARIMKERLDAFAIAARGHEELMP